MKTAEDAPDDGLGGVGNYRRHARARRRDVCRGALGRPLRQPTITRFVLLPDEDERWRCDVTRHWNIESPR
jgi:hypothetical protein